MSRDQLALSLNLGIFRTDKGDPRPYPVAIQVFFWDERRLGIRLRSARGLMGREERKISFFPSHETPPAPQPNPQSSLIPKKHLNSDWVRVWGDPGYSRVPRVCSGHVPGLQTPKFGYKFW